MPTNRKRKGAPLHSAEAALTFQEFGSGLLGILTARQDSPPSSDFGRDCSL